MIREAMMKKGEEDMPMKEDMPEDEMQESPEHEAAPGDANEDAAEGEPQDEKKQDPAALKLVLAAMKILYSEGTSGAIEKMLRSGADASRGIAATTLFVIKTLADNAKGQIPPQSFMSAAESIALLVAELATAAGHDVGEDTVDQAKQLVAQALAQAQGQQAQAAPQQPAQPGGMIRQAMGA